MPEGIVLVTMSKALAPECHPQLSMCQYTKGNSFACSSRKNGLKCTEIYAAIVGDNFVWTLRYQRWRIDHWTKTIFISRVYIKIIIILQPRINFHDKYLPRSQKLVSPMSINYSSMYMASVIFGLALLVFDDRNVSRYFNFFYLQYRSRCAIYYATQ